MDRGNLQTLLGRSLNRLLRRFELDSVNLKKSEHFYYLAVLLARAGRFEEAFAIIKNIKPKGRKENTFRDVIIAYRSYLSMSQKEGVEKLSCLEVLLQIPHLPAARLWTNFGNRDYRYKTWIKIYCQTGDKNDFNQLKKEILASREPFYFDDKRALIQEMIRVETKAKGGLIIFWLETLVKTWIERRNLLEGEEALLWFDLYSSTHNKNYLFLGKKALKKAQRTGSYSGDQLKMAQRRLAEVTGDTKTLEKMEAEEQKFLDKENSSFEGLLDRFDQTGEELYLQRAIDLSYQENDPGKLISMEWKIICHIDRHTEKENI